MPELPEVEVICKRLGDKLPGTRIEKIEVLTPNTFKEAGGHSPDDLLDATIFRVFRVGKLINIETDNRLRLLIHLKMTGQLIFNRDKTLDPYCRLLLTVRDENGRAHYLHFNDMRRFGYLLLRPAATAETLPPLSLLGPDALTVSLGDFRKLLKSSGRRIKSLLLDQQRIAGLGNIYIDEILHRSGVHPLTEADKLGGREVEALYRSMTAVLKRAISRGGSSVRNYRDSAGRDGSFQEEHVVYRRQGEPCRKCSTSITRTVVAGRGTYFCPACQKK